jgi:hypothetical protein
MGLDEGSLVVDLGHWRAEAGCLFGWVAGTIEDLKMEAQRLFEDQ